jgi:hypothetical protein
LGSDPITANVSKTGVTPTRWAQMAVAKILEIKARFPTKRTFPSGRLFTCCPDDAESCLPLQPRSQHNACRDVTSSTPNMINLLDIVKRRRKKATV